MMKRFQNKDYNGQVTRLWRGIGAAVSLLIIVMFGMSALPTQGAILIPNDLNRTREEMSAVPAPSHSIVINFDTDPFGNPIPDRTLIGEQYASIGVHFQPSAFFTRRRLSDCYPNYFQRPSLNYLSTWVANDSLPSACPLPIGGKNAKLVAKFDFPVGFASIEGLTDNTAGDGDVLTIQAFDALGNLLGTGQATCNNVANPNPPPAFKEGICLASVSAPGIRRVEVIQNLIDAFDTLTLRPEHKPPDLAISKSDGQITVRPGQVLTYTLTISNISAENATGVAITDTLPLHTIFLGASDGGFKSGGVVTWPPFNMAAGASVTRRLTVQVNTPLPAGVGTLTNTATVADDGSNGADPTPGNNTTSDIDQVDTSTDLAITKIDSPDPVQMGNELTYSLTATNIGPSPATDVIITDTLPGGVTFVSATPSQGPPCTLTVNTVTCNPGSLAVGASATVTIKVTPTTTGTITNTARVSGNQPDSNPANNTATAVTAVIACSTSPVDVMLVIDRSGSMANAPLDDEKFAAKSFIDLMHLASDQVGLVSFADNATLDQPLTHDANAVKRAVDALSANGQTNMTAGINTAQAELVSSRHNPNARPAMIFMSDGMPTGGDTPVKALAAAQAAKNAGTRLFTIGLGAVDTNLMRQLASSPSDYFFAPSSADLAAIYQQIAQVINCGRAAVKVSPAIKRVPLSGGDFIIDVVAEDVTNLAAYQVELTYDPAIVRVMAVTPGPFLGSTGRTVAPVGPTIDHQAGRVAFGAFTFGSQPGVNGTGVLATVTLEPQTRGTSQLTLKNLQLADPSSNRLTAAVKHGMVEVIACFGDFDGDNDVDIFDLQEVANHWNCRQNDPCYELRFDTEPDGDIDAFDLQRFAAAWGTTCPAPMRSFQTMSANLTATTTTAGLKLMPSSLQVAPGSRFTITVAIQDVTNVGVFQTDLVYDPGVVHVEGVSIGPFLGSTGRTVFPLHPSIDHSSGRVTFGAFTFGSQPGASGSGDMAYIVFQMQSAGQTTLNFQQTGVGDPQGNPLFLSSLEGSTISSAGQLYLPLISKEN